jgi:hypothetical protein
MARVDEGRPNRAEAPSEEEDGEDDREMDGMIGRNKTHPCRSTASISAQSVRTAVVGSVT